MNTIARIATVDTEQPNRQADAPAPMYFFVTFWGTKYREWFCRYLAPSLLADGNLDAVRNIPGSRFLICTPNEDWDALKKTAVFARLSRVIDVEHLDLPEMPGLHKYYRMSKGHKLLTQACHAAGAIGIYLAVDTIVPAGSIEELVRISAQGAQVVLCTAIRFDMEGVTQDLGALIDADKPLCVSRRDAVAVGLRNLHPESLAGEFDKPFFGELSREHGRNHFPTCCFWRVPNESGVVIHTHNWAPFLIDFRAITVHDTTVFDGWAIDGDYIHRNFGSARVGSQIVVIADSDKLFLLGLTPRAEMVPSLNGSWWKAGPTIGALMRGLILAAAVSDKYVDPLRREIYRMPVRWHARDISANWVRIERRAQAVIDNYVVNQGRYKAGQLCWRIMNSVLWHASRIPRAYRLIGAAVRGDFGARKTLVERVKAGPRRLAYTYLNLVYACFGEHAYSYNRCVLKALAGDALERKRISKRLRKVLHAARLRVVR